MKQKKDREMKQSAVRLPRNLYERLKEAGGARGMGEEIRRRLEYAFKAEEAASDEITEEIIAEIRDIARDLSRYGPWHTDRDAYDVFKATLNGLLLNHQPRNEPKPETKARFQAVYGVKTAEEIGLILAQAAIFSYGRERRGALTGPTGLAGPATGSTGFTGQVGRSTGSGSIGPAGLGQVRSGE